MSHFVQQCRDHNTVYSQCRCPAPDKTVTLVDCQPEICDYHLQPPVEEEQLSWTCTHGDPGCDCAIDY